VYLFTDSNEWQNSSQLTVIKTRKMGWPYDSSRRLEVYLNASRLFSQTNYMIDIDVDLYLNAPVCEELIGDRVAAITSWFFKRPQEEWPYERDPNSAAFIDYGESGEAYYAGGYIAATTQEFINICEALTAMNRHDEAKGITAKWHDERLYI
jgi:hypothetical protein